MIFSDVFEPDHKILGITESGTRTKTRAAKRTDDAAEYLEPYIDLDRAAFLTRYGKRSCIYSQEIFLQLVA